MSQEMVYESKTKQTSTVIGAIILFKDISEFHEQEDRERERLQVAYEKADLESRAKTEFMNRMSHDIRTPINGICGMVDVGDHYSNDLQKQADCRKKIREASNILLELINEVLDMSKLESGEIYLEEKPFNIYQLINEVIDVVGKMADEREIKVEHKTPEIIHKDLIGSPIHLKRLLMNILSNAVKYNKDYGKIYLSSREIPSDQDGVVMLEFICQDTGIGMSEDYIKNHLFTPFSQAKQDARTRYKGTGLGMSIVKGLVDKLGGSIEVKSEVGVGTQIKVILAYQLDTSNTAKQDTSKLDLKDKRILLVEDNEINMEVAEFYLNAVHANVDKAWNGLEAVEKVKEQPNKYSVILMDIMMPKMNGDEAAKCIRKINPSIPIVAMSAQSEYSIDQTIMNDSISKPIDEQKLNHILSKYVS